MEQDQESKVAFQEYFRSLFSLKESTDYGGTIEHIRAGIDFRNGNIWALILAILIASVGLNTNSPAVIIGAMLISPLMGPIVGIGFGLGTNNFTMMKRSLRNLLIATTTALVASTIYFSLSPLAEIQSELLARTRPTLYDVLIAFFGGSAGIIALSRKNQNGTIMAGVAIATALMPPLCTAGFGLAQKNPAFFFGALHLFLINALFICLATLLFVRLMNFRRKSIDPRHLVQTRLTLTVLVAGIAIPSIYTGFTVVREAQFTEKAREFIDSHLSSDQLIVINHTTKFSLDSSSITLTAVGEPISDSLLKNFEREMAKAGLKRTKLTVMQPKASGKTPESDTRNTTNQRAMESQLATLDRELRLIKADSEKISLLSDDLQALFPELSGIARGELYADSSAELVSLIWKTPPSEDKKVQIDSYLRQKLNLPSVTMVHAVQDVRHE